jgi:hypothetical protein
VLDAESSAFFVDASLVTVSESMGNKNVTDVKKKMGELTQQTTW